MTCHVYCKCFLQLYVIFKHNFVVFSRFVLNLCVVPRLELFLKCSYFGPKIEARCSYKIVLIKKKRVTNYIGAHGRHCYVKSAMMTSRSSFSMGVLYCLICLILGVILCIHYQHQRQVESRDRHITLDIFCLTKSLSVRPEYCRSIVTIRYCYI